METNWDASILPNDVFILKDNEFFECIKHVAGDIVCEILKIQMIDSAQVLINSDDLLSFLQHNSPEINFFRDKVCFKTENGSFLIKSGITTNMISRNRTCTEKSVDILATFIDTITNNLHKSSNNYRYSKSIEDFALSLYILGDYAGIIRKINYDQSTNSFVGFATPLIIGIPVAKYYQTNSFDQLKSRFSSTDKSPLLNIHMIQRLQPANRLPDPTAFLLSAYGVVNQSWATQFKKCPTQLNSTQFLS
ncbi:unnamed protein product [Rotaria magnacalcarata]|uniref:Uncharacterized protein n=1 Tax=Rotaria magnacalcarata TaxID=392030 RepID=A0A8S2MY20_9BILA|nr:unnamed protein product [Rotaria magnacalcarata]